MKKLYNLIALIAVVGALLAWFGSRQTAGDYNDYVAKIRPAIAQQDRILDELQKATDLDAGKQVAGWIKRQDAVLAQFKAVQPKDQEIAALHHRWIERSEALSDGLRALQRWTQSQDKKALAEYRKHCTTAGNRLQSFITRRDIYFKKHDLKLEE